MLDSEDIVGDSIASFYAQTGIVLTADAGGRIILSNSGVHYRFTCQVMRSVTAPKATEIELVNGRPHVLVANYISDPAKKYLKEQDINYLDAAGNAYLKVPEQLLIYVETGKSARTAPTPKGRAFTQTGLKVVYQFLTNDTVNRPYREIGQLAGVSIDTVSKTIKDLLSSGYLIEFTHKVYELNKQEELIDNWVTAFNTVLRPKIKSALFSFGKGLTPHELAERCPPNTFAGELAADVLGTNLIGERATLYTDQPFHALAKELDLVPASKEGAVEIVRQFWNGTSSGRRTVHPLLVYADLRYRPTPRNLEAAALLYETHVRPAL